ncbi:hypothetical protein [Spiroplasma endosymbiont of Dasysyrphus albostriatus]|uniref:hypothetical protein n=1 Tax=Spiroplasma endosymbiont of Dasysyrphus albostriatus TaxID=3066299 RepID=UPI0030D56ECD
MMPTQNTNITWQDIYNSFYRLTENINANLEPSLGNLARSLCNVILVTSEAMRFSQIRSIIRENLSDSERYITIGFNHQNRIYNMLISWGSETRLLNHENSNFQNIIDRIRDWAELLRRSDDEFADWTFPISTNEMTNLFEVINTRILLYFFAINLNQNLNNCVRRQPRKINKNFWHQKFCELKPEIDKIQGKVNTIKIIENDSIKNWSIKKGDLFIGTDSGFYTINQNGNVIKRMSTINNVKNIIINNENSAYVTNEKCEIYNLKFKDWSYEKTIMESCDLNKELKIYYYKNKENQIYTLTPTLNNVNKTEYQILNLGSISSLNYEKIEFLGDIDNNCWGTMVNWGDWVYTNNCNANWGTVHKLKGTTIKQKLQDKNNKFHDIIENTKGELPKNKEQYLQSFDDESGLAKITVNQRFGLTWYWENENYFLKVYALQNCEWWTSYANFDCHIKIGNGIRLYNNEEVETQIAIPNYRKRREIFDINNLKEKNEWQNTTQWDKNITNLINHEQHLPIANHTNVDGPLAT